MLPTRRLPRNPGDQDQVSDRQGNIWQYSAYNNSWVERGTLVEPPDVTESSDGLATPTVFKKLQYLRQLYDQGPDRFRTLKLAPGLDAYWYWLRSADKLFRFTPEGESGLRVEVDRGRLYQILLKQVCPGARGPTGDPGDPGPDGQSGAPEGCFLPSGVDGDRLNFALFVPTPISTPISLRLYQTVSSITAQAVASADQIGWWAAHLNKYGFNSQTGLVERQFAALKRAREAQATGMVKQAAAGPCALALGAVSSGTPSSSPSVELIIDPADARQVSFTQLPGGVQLDQARTTASLVYDRDSRVLCGTLVLAQGQWGPADGWCLRGRQVGPPGPAGPDGTCMVTVTHCAIGDDPLLATCPVVSLRADCEQEILYWMCSELLPERCVDRLQLSPGAAAVATDGALKSVFAAAQVTTEQCKKVYRYKLELPTDDVPALDLLHWDPQPGCVSKRNFDRHSFDWIPATDMPACNPAGLRWYGADQLNPTRFPWPFLVEQPPAVDSCCADDMFYCPNNQEQPGACPDIPPPIVIASPPPPPPPTPPPAPPAPPTVPPPAPPTPPPAGPPPTTPPAGPPAAPPTGPPAPPPATTPCCMPLGHWTLSADSFGPALPFTNYGDSLLAARSLGRTPAGLRCQTPLVNMGVQYSLFCAGSSVTLTRRFNCCGDVAATQSKTIPFTNTGRLVFAMPADRPNPLCSLSAETLIVTGNCPGGVDQPPPPPPVAPPPPATVCPSGQTSCGELLFTGFGLDRASSIVVRDKFGDTPLHVVTFGGRSLWRGCAMRQQVPQAYTGVNPGFGQGNGSGGTLVQGGPLSVIQVPVMYELSCVPFPEGRPTPSPAASNPTSGWALTLSWPIRKPGETIPVMSIIGGAYTCNEDTAFGIRVDRGWYWEYLNATRFVATRPDCSTRPFNLSFNFSGVGAVFTTDSASVTVIEQGGLFPPVTPKRLSDDFDIPVVRI